MPSRESITTRPPTPSVLTHGRRLPAARRRAALAAVLAASFLAASLPSAEARHRRSRTQRRRSAFGRLFAVDRSEPAQDVELGHPVRVRIGVMEAQETVRLTAPAPFTVKAGRDGWTFQALIIKPPDNVAGAVIQRTHKASFSPHHFASYGTRGIAGVASGGVLAATSVSGPFESTGRTKAYSTSQGALLTSHFPSNMSAARDGK